MNIATITTDILIVGGGTGGTAAAIQAARRGVNTVLVSELPWLGGMLTAAGVSAPDGNELLAFQTGIWGAFIRELRQRQSGGLDNAWVSFFTYEPKVGAAIFHDWVKALPNLQWISGRVPRAVLRKGDRILGVRFEDMTVHAKITLDGTELGDLLALGDIPHRWGWETQNQFSEPSAPDSLTDPQEPLRDIIQTYPVQSPTWIVCLKKAENGCGKPILPMQNYDASIFQDAWKTYGPERFLTYGKLPNHQFMINWPQQGNDYGVGLERLLQGEAAWREWAEEAIAHSQNFAHFIQSTLGQEYELAAEAFPTLPGKLGGGAFALMPYYRESRRLVGLTTVTELDILPIKEGRVATLPINEKGEMSAIAIGNYPNDHHYPGFEMPLAPKSVRWGGRWTGTPFAIPYEAIVPVNMNGFIVCDKAISISHIANGATRLQPVVLGIGQAAGMAAALCVEQGCHPRELSVAALQTALLEEPTAPAAVVPLFDNLPHNPNWKSRQQHYRAIPETYPKAGNVGIEEPNNTDMIPEDLDSVCLQGILHILRGGENWQAELQLTDGHRVALVTLNPNIHDVFKKLENHCSVVLKGYLNPLAGWIQVANLSIPSQYSGVSRN